MSAVPAVLAPLRLPHRFGAYVLFDRIGVGGMAEIYLARGKTRVGAARLAVVKLVLPAYAGDSHFAAMLTAEAKLAAQLSHANVVQTYDLGREDDRLYIAMEYVEGFDLNELLRRCTRARLPLPADFALFIVGETLRALDYAHRRKDPTGAPLGIVHRDVSPSNVLISFEGEVKLCDFGIARASATVDIASTALEGKAAYMSPEHARGEAIDARADVFAAGILLWELLAGRRLYKASPEKDALTIAREADTPTLPDRGLPDHARLAGIVARALHRDVAERYPTALAFARDLDAYAMDSRLFASPLRLGAFLTDHFGSEIVQARRARERAAAALEMGPPVRIEVLSTPPPKPAEAPVAANAAASEPELENDTEKVPPPAMTLPPRAPKPARKPPATPAQPGLAPSEMATEILAPRTRSRRRLALGAQLALAGIVIATLAASAGYWLAHH